MREETFYQRTMIKFFKVSVWELSKSSGKLIKLSFGWSVSEEDRSGGGRGGLGEVGLELLDIILVNRGKKVGILDT